MFNFTSILRHIALAFVLIACSVSVQAGVVTTYHVELNTDALPTSVGYLDFAFLNSGGAAAATATISNLQGAITGIDLIEGDVTNPSTGTFIIGNGLGSNYLSHAIDLGGVFSFDLSFAGDFLTVMGNETSIFAIALLDADFNPLGDTGFAAIFAVAQLSDFGPGGVGVGFDPALANINAVPEPSELLMMLSGLAMVGFLRRRAAKRAP